MSMRIFVICINKKLQEDGTILSHYVLITDLSSLLYSQNKTGKCKVYYCRRCLNNFRIQEKLNDHVKSCNKNRWCTKNNISRR